MNYLSIYIIVENKLKIHGAAKIEAHLACPWPISNSYSLVIFISVKFFCVTLLEITVVEECIKSLTSLNSFIC